MKIANARNDLNMNEDDQTQDTRTGLCRTLHVEDNLCECERFHVFVRVCICTPFLCWYDYIVFKNRIIDTCHGITCASWYSLYIKKTYGEKGSVDSEGLQNSSHLGQPRQRMQQKLWCVRYRLMFGVVMANRVRDRARLGSCLGAWARSRHLALLRNMTKHADALRMKQWEQDEFESNGMLSKWRTYLLLSNFVRRVGFETPASCEFCWCLSCFSWASKMEVYNEVTSTPYHAALLGPFLRRILDNACLFE